MTAFLRWFATKTSIAALVIRKALLAAELPALALDDHRGSDGETLAALVARTVSVEARIDAAAEALVAENDPVHARRLLGRWRAHGHPVRSSELAHATLAAFCAAAHRLTDRCLDVASLMM